MEKINSLIIFTVLWTVVTAALFFGPLMFFDVKNTVMRIVINIGLVCSSVWGLWLSRSLRSKDYLLLSRIIYGINVLLLIALANTWIHRIFMAQYCRLTMEHGMHGAFIKYEQHHASYICLFQNSCATIMGGEHNSMACCAHAERIRMKEIS